MLAEETKTDFDPFADAAQERTYDLFGIVEINAWACVTIKGQGKLPFDENVHKPEQRTTAIDIFIQPLPEIDVKYPKTCEDHWVKWATAWNKVTLPSIRAAGIEDLHELNGKWARVTRVAYGETYPKKDSAGNLTGETAEKKTMKFLAFYDTEEECRAAAVAAGVINPNANGNGHNVPAAIPGEDPEKANAYIFMKAIIANVAHGKTTVEQMQEAIKAHNAYSHVSKHITAESPEAVELINQVLKGKGNVQP